MILTKEDLVLDKDQCIVFRTDTQEDIEDLYKQLLDLKYRDCIDNNSINCKTDRIYITQTIMYSINNLTNEYKEHKHIHFKSKEEYDIDNILNNLDKISIKL